VLRVDDMTLDYQEFGGNQLLSLHRPDGRAVDILNRNGGGMLTRDQALCTALFALTFFILPSLYWKRRDD
jgi:ABC-type Na+ transport system ATPase subunit NatA